MADKEHRGEGSGSTPKGKEKEKEKRSRELEIADSQRRTRRDLVLDNKKKQELISLPFNTLTLIVLFLILKFVRMCYRLGGDLL